MPSEYLYEQGLWTGWRGCAISFNISSRLSDMCKTTWALTIEQDPQSVTKIGSSAAAETKDKMRHNKEGWKLTISKTAPLFHRFYEWGRRLLCSWRRYLLCQDIEEHDAVVETIYISLWTPFHFNFVCSHRKDRRLFASTAVYVSRNVSTPGPSGPHRTSSMEIIWIFEWLHIKSKSKG